MPGGEGDDDLSSTAVGNTLEGGVGDDTLTGIDATDMDGGSGDDQITYVSDTGLNDSVAHIDGGEGDDVINILADAGVGHPDRGGAIVTGGSGRDAFNITLDLQNSQEEVNDDDGLLESNIALVTDFGPAEDTLVIEVESDAETADRDVVAEFDQTEDNGTFTTVLSLIFDETETATQAATTLTAISRSPFTLDKIRLAGV